MRITNNINTIDFDAEGTVFWVVYDPDTRETLMSVEFDSYKWMPNRLCVGDNFGLSELDETARFSCYDDAESVAQDVARILAEENPGEDINLEIHRVRLKTVEMVQDIEDETPAKCYGRSEEEEDEEEDEGFESNRFDRPHEDLEEEEQSDAARVFGSQPFDPRGDLKRQREGLERRADSIKKPKAKKSTKKGKRS